MVALRWFWTWQGCEYLLLLLLSPGGRQWGGAGPGVGRHGGGTAADLVELTLVRP